MAPPCPGCESFLPGGATGGQSPQALLGRCSCPGPWAHSRPETSLLGDEAAQCCPGSTPGTAYQPACLVHSKSSAAQWLLGPRIPLHFVAASPAPGSTACTAHSLPGLCLDPRATRPPPPNPVAHFRASCPHVGHPGSLRPLVCLPGSLGIGLSLQRPLLVPHTPSHKGLASTHQWPLLDPGPGSPSHISEVKVRKVSWRWGQELWIPVQLGTDALCDIRQVS